MSQSCVHFIHLFPLLCSIIYYYYYLYSFMCIMLCLSHFFSNSEPLLLPAWSATATVDLLCLFVWWYSHRVCLRGYKASLLWYLFLLFFLFCGQKQKSAEQQQRLFSLCLSLDWLLFQYAALCLCLSIILQEEPESKTAYLQVQIHE